MHMMPLSKATPREFGQALKHARESAGLTLEAIAARTKIGGRMLAAIEDGEFGRLPSQVFARMFVRQYLEFIGAAPEEWLPEFDAAWRRFADSSQTPSIGPSLPVKKRRLGPWMIGLALVAAGVAAVLLVEKRQGQAPPETGEAPALAVAQPAPAGPSAPTPAPPLQPAPAAPPPPTTLVVRALQAPCWVELRIAGERASSRLLVAGAAWEVAAGGRAIDLVLGDAGAVSVAYMGDVRNPAGRPGEVARIHFGGNATPPAGP
jgi:cytoskeleton protein RodZ